MEEDHSLKYTQFTFQDLVAKGLLVLMHVFIEHEKRITYTEGECKSSISFYI
mgnify:CR=1 FL=1